MSYWEGRKEVVQGGRKSRYGGTEVGIAVQGSSRRNGFQLYLRMQLPQFYPFWASSHKSQQG